MATQTTGPTGATSAFPARPYDNVTLFGMTLVVCCYCVVYGMFVWYLDNVWPWQYGIPKDPLFFIKRSYWFYSRRKQVTISESTTDSAEPGCAHRGRRRPQPRAASTWPASTSHSETDSARRSMGFCPQENVLFLGLTVLEHLQFFARIRSDSWATGDKAIEEILEAFNLAEKRDALACSLSWGTMRKLQLGVAIVGSPLIVVLDEPTAGADPECKGALWECVLRFHEDKTMLLTTHSMEEADTLGDRIAVLASGRLRCCGSPLFLRTTYGTGYWIRAGMKNFSPARALADLGAALRSPGSHQGRRSPNAQRERGRSWRQDPYSGEGAGKRRLKEYESRSSWQTAHL
ncbi:hypothetical protein MRX96_038788 [Rhipicephalus microplus]